MREKAATGPESAKKIIITIGVSILSYNDITVFFNTNINKQATNKI